MGSKFVLNGVTSFMDDWIGIVKKQQSIWKRNKLRGFELLLFPADRKTRYLIFFISLDRKGMKSSTTGLPFGPVEIVSRNEIILPFAFLDLFWQNFSKMYNFGIFLLCLVIFPRKFDLYLLLKIWISLWTDLAFKFFMNLATLVCVHILWRGMTRALWCVVTQRKEKWLLDGCTPRRRGRGKQAESV